MGCFPEPEQRGHLKEPKSIRTLRWVLTLKRVLGATCGNSRPCDLFVQKGRNEELRI